MHGAMRIISLFVATLVTVHVVAQDIPMLSRAALESLVHPALSDTASRVLRAEKESIDLGRISDEELCRATFKLCNTSDREIAITALRSTCSCLKVKNSIESIAPNELSSVSVEFNPAGRSGRFSVDLLVYSTLDEELPSLRLNLCGEIESSDEWSHLPFSMGVVRLSRKSVHFDRYTLSERIAVANTSDEYVVLSAQPTIEGITLRTEPERLAPNGEGDIVISYTPTSHTAQDIESIVIIEGCGKAHPTDRMIKITIKR